MTVVEHNGRLYGLGAKPRPHDERERKYRLVTAPGVDLSVFRSVAQWRSRIENQKRMGSCVAHATTSGAELLAKQAGLSVQQLDRLWVYWHGREKEGTIPDDAGMYLADGCDLVSAGVPAESAEPLGYIDDPTYRPPPEVEASPRFDYVKGHQPIYAEGPHGFLPGICQALDAGMPVTIAMNWRAEFFEPAGGILPLLPNSQIVGGHALLLLTYTPPDPMYPEGIGWCDQSWGEEWGAPWISQICARNPDAVAGTFGIRGELFSNGIVGEARALSPEVVIPTPPEPPAPDTDGYQQAMDVAGNVVKQMMAYASEKPKSTSRKWWALGGDWVVAKMAEARPGGPLGDPRAEKPE